MLPLSAPEASVLPSGENVTDRTCGGCDNSRGWKVAKSHTRTTPSAPAEASNLPSGENANDQIAPRWPLSSVLIFFVATSQSLIVWSKLEVANILPSGENTANNTSLECAFSVTGERP